MYRLTPIFAFLWFCFSCASAKAYEPSTPVGYRTYAAQASVATISTAEVAEAVSGGTAASFTGDADSTQSVSKVVSKPARKIIQNGSITLASKTPRDEGKKIEALVSRVQGYIVSSSQNDDRATLELRVPSEQLESVMEELAGYGKLISRNIYGRDVSEQYADAQLRVESTQKLIARYQELLNKGEKMEDLLTIEREISRLTQELEQLQGNLKFLDNHIAYAEISVTIRKKRILGPLGLAFYGVGWVVQKLFVIK